MAKNRVVVERFADHCKAGYPDLHRQVWLPVLYNIAGFASQQGGQSVSEQPETCEAEEVVTVRPADAEAE